MVEAQFTTANSRNATVVDSSCLITERWCCVCFDSRQYHRTPSPMLSVCIFLGFELLPSHGRSASGEATLLIMARRTTTPTVNQQPKQKKGTMKQKIPTNNLYESVGLDCFISFYRHTYRIRCSVKIALHNTTSVCLYFPMNRVRTHHPFRKVYKVTS